MQLIKINELNIYYNSKLELFKKLLLLHGSTKKSFAMKFELSYTYVNSWGTKKNDEYIKFPSWVFHYLKDITFFKVATLKQVMTLEYIYDQLQEGETLSSLYKRINNPITIGPSNPLQLPMDDTKLDCRIYNKVLCKMYFDDIIFSENTDEDDS